MTKNHTFVSMNFPKNLSDKLETRRQNNSLRFLPQPSGLIDFSSNDYIGFSKSEAIFNETHQFLLDHNIKNNGATGSRLISGNHTLYTETENYIAQFHQSLASLHLATIDLPAVALASAKHSSHHWLAVPHNDRSMPV